MEWGDFLLTHGGSQWNGAIEVFLSSGFQPRSSARTVAQPLDEPVILEIQRGGPGELVASGSKEFSIARLLTAGEEN
jgi:hypothetical protein